VLSTPLIGVWGVCVNDKNLSNMMKIALKSPAELAHSDLEGNVDVQKGQGRRVAV